MSLFRPVQRMCRVERAPRTAIFVASAFALAAACLSIVGGAAAEARKASTSPASKGLPECWKRLIVLVVEAREGEAKEMDVLGLVTISRGTEQCRELEAALKETTAALPDAALRTVVDALARPVKARRLHGPEMVVSKSRFTFDTWDGKLFSAEIDAFRRCMQVAVYAYLHRVSITPEQRTKVAGQWRKLLDEIRRQCDSAHYDKAVVDENLANAEKDLQTATEESGQYGPGFVPLSDDEFAATVKDIADAFSREAGASAGSSDSEGLFIRNQVRQFIGLRLYREPGGVRRNSTMPSEYRALSDAWSDASVRVARLRDGAIRKLTTTRATSRPSSQPVAPVVP